MLRQHDQPIGRPAGTTYNAGTAYEVDYAYNASTGHLDNVTYPTNTAGYRLRAEYLYTHGILSQVRDFNAPATVWWQLNAEAARGYPIDEQFDNGVRALSDFDGMTGHLNWRMSGNDAQFACRDKELRQWMPCVTFSASPRTVTHASQRCALAQSISSADGRTWQDRRSDAAAAQGGGSELKNGRQCPKDESKTTAPMGRAALPGLKAAWVSATQTGNDSENAPR